MTKELRNLLSTVPRGAQETVAAFVRTIFYQPDHSSAIDHLKDVAGMLRERGPRCSAAPAHRSMGGSN